MRRNVIIAPLAAAALVAATAVTPAEARDWGHGWHGGPLALGAGIVGAGIGLATAPLWAGAYAAGYPDDYYGDPGYGYGPGYAYGYDDGYYPGYAGYAAYGAAYPVRYRHRHVYYPGYAGYNAYGAAYPVRYRHRNVHYRHSHW
jgi:hypothetical protein